MAIIEKGYLKCAWWPLGTRGS